MEIEYKRLTSENFHPDSLNSFLRYQQVTSCWRQVEGEWKLVPMAFVEDWSREQCHLLAEDVVAHMEKDQTAFGAFSAGQVVGFATLSHRFFGDTARYLELVCFQVSQPYRGKGIGRSLFQLVCQEARALGAEKLYISGHSSKESQGAYKALGCVHAKEINEEIAHSEPFDVQLEYDLQ